MKNYNIEQLNSLKLQEQRDILNTWARGEDKKSADLFRETQQGGLFKLLKTYLASLGAKMVHGSG
ncbi:hypothetical protein [Legionella brunensis]|nr:hypothetical protein [Legionella brunensis]